MYYKTEAQNLFIQVICCLQKSNPISQPVHIIARGSSEDKDE